MDRDKRWDRVKLAYDALVSARAARAPDARRPSTQPTRAARPTSSWSPTVGRRGPRRRRRATATLIFFNFRPDRARELTRAFIDPRLQGVRPRPAPAARRLRQHDRVRARTSPCRSPSRPSAPSTCWPTSWPSRPAPAAHRRDREVRARDLLLQRRRRARVPGETASSCPAPKVATYDLKPEMSARGHRRARATASTTATLRLHHRQLRQPRHGRAHRRARRRRSRPSRRSTPASGGSSKRVRARAASASSPPTTATPR